MREKIVVSPDLMPDWFKKYKGLQKEINEQLFRNLKTGSGGLTLEDLQALVEHRSLFSLISGSTEEQLGSWVRFYIEEFNIKIGEIIIPGRHLDFDRLIIVAKGITAQQVYDQCQKYFECRKYSRRSLDEMISNNDRMADKQTYAVWIREEIEVGEELKNLSADQLKEKDIQGITLTERLLYGLKYFKETEEYLDTESTTYCTGSRDASGGVPSVYWDFGDCMIYLALRHPDSSDDDLRSREVFS